MQTSENFKYIEYEYVYSGIPFKFRKVQSCALHL